MFSISPASGENTEDLSFLALLSPHKLTLIISLLLGLLAALAALAQPLVIGNVLSAVRLGGSIVQPASLLAGLFLADSLLNGLQSYLLARTGEKVVFEVRRTLAGRLLRMTISEHDHRKLGDLLSRVGTDTTLLRMVLTQSLSNGVVGAFVFLGAFLLMAVIDLFLLLVASACVTVATVVVVFASSRVRSAMVESHHSLGLLVSALERALRALRTVKVSRAEEREDYVIKAHSSAAYRAGVRAAGYKALAAPATSFALQGSFALVLGVGGARLASGAISIEEFVSFLLYLLYSVSPLVMILTSLVEWQQGRAGITRIQEISKMPVEHANKYAQPTTATIRGLSSAEFRRYLAQPHLSARQGSVAGPPVVAFDRVCFGYDQNLPVLEELSFTIEEPGLTALVGPSGAGKSTLFALLVRFFDPTAGMIRLDGINLRDIPLHELRRRVAYVEQDSPVMAGSIRENLLYAAPKATEEELQETLDLVNLRPCIERLPAGLDAEVGDGGVLLSGGERQRVAAARMMLATPRLLLLDEVTSQLDARNERVLRQAIRRITERHAVVAVAHRLSTVKDAQKIIVLEAGKVRGSGTHDHLLRTDQLYLDLVKTQLIEGGERA